MTELARFCHRRGDIDHRFTPSPTAAQGIAGHQRLFASRPASYRSEYGVEYRHLEPGLALTLRGRADGYDSEQSLVEEIKTCRVDPATIPEAVSRLHLSQGRLYAAIIAAQQEVPSLSVKLTWFNIDTLQEQGLCQSYTRSELMDFLQDSLAQFAAGCSCWQSCGVSEIRVCLHWVSPTATFERGSEK